MRGLALLAVGAGRARAVTTTSAPAPGRPEVVDRTAAGTEVWRITTEDHLQTNISVSYTHLTLPTIYSV